MACLYLQESQPEKKTLDIRPRIKKLKKILKILIFIDMLKKAR
jgi:hypothetical protein